MKTIFRSILALSLASNIFAQQPIETLSPAQKVTMRSSIGLGTVATLDASTTGGANKVLQYDSSGNLTLAPYANGSPSSAFQLAGNVFIPDQQGLQWTNPNTGQQTANIRHWFGHDSFGGEFLIASPWRIAVLANGPVQLGANNLVRDAQYFFLTSGQSGTADILRNSKAAAFQTTVYSGGSQISNEFALQAAPLDTTGTNSALRFYANASISGSGGGAVDAKTGNASGTLVSEIANGGVWHLGQAPAYTALTDGATITQTCSKYKTNQTGTVTLGGNRTLAFSGLESGMRGVIYVSQPATGGPFTLTPSNANVLGLSSTANYCDKVVWEYDGVYVNFEVTQNVQREVVVSDADAQTFITSASLSTAQHKAAIVNLVAGLKASNVAGTGTLWSKAYALYPFVGGTASAHSYNLRNTASYQITNSGTWTTGVTHNANGITGDGTTGFGDTNFNFNAVSAINSASSYVYCRTQTLTTGTYFYQASGPSRPTWGMEVSGASVRVQGPNSASANTVSRSAGSDFRKHLAINRSASNAVQLYVNEAFSTSSNASTGAVSDDFFILTQNYGGTAGGFTTANLAFAWFGQSLTEAEWTEFRNIVTSYQTALGRANP